MQGLDDDESAGTERRVERGVFGDWGVVVQEGLRVYAGHFYLLLLLML